MNEPTPRQSDPNAGETHVSTGSLPSRDEVRALVETAHERFAREAGGIRDRNRLHLRLSGDRHD
jgi:hypothetical protein